MKVFFFKHAVHGVASTLEERRTPTLRSQMNKTQDVKQGTFDFARIEGSKLSSDPPLSNGFSLELLRCHSLPVLDVVPVCHRMTCNLVPVVPPFVHQGVVRVRVGDEMGRPEQRVSREFHFPFSYLRAHPLGLL